MPETRVRPLLVWLRREQQAQRKSRARMWYSILLRAALLVAVDLCIRMRGREGVIDSVIRVFQVDWARRGRSLSSARHGKCPLVPPAQVGPPTTTTSSTPTHSFSISSPLPAHAPPLLPGVLACAASVVAADVEAVSLVGRAGLFHFVLVLLDLDLVLLHPITRRQRQIPVRAGRSVRARVLNVPPRARAVACPVLSVRA